MACWIFRDVVLKCACGTVVKLYEEIRARKVNRVVLCDGKKIYGGHVPYYALFKNREIQDIALVEKYWEWLPCDTYTLYHADEELSKLRKLSNSLGISLAQAADVLKHLNTASKIESFIAFAKDYPSLSMREALKVWNSIDVTEFRLLNSAEVP
ncbi:MAG: hypothetical protein WCC94_11560 [Candidatus Bathyarchaeia archaeon]